MLLLLLTWSCERWYLPDLHRVLCRFASLFHLGRGNHGLKIKVYLGQSSQKDPLAQVYTSLIVKKLRLHQCGFSDYNIHRSIRRTGSHSYDYDKPSESLEWKSSDVSLQPRLAGGYPISSTGICQRSDSLTALPYFLQNKGVKCFRFFEKASRFSSVEAVSTRLWFRRVLVYGSPSLYGMFDE